MSESKSFIQLKKSKLTGKHILLARESINTAIEHLNNARMYVTLESEDNALILISEDIEAKNRDLSLLFGKQIIDSQHVLIPIPDDKEIDNS